MRPLRALLVLSVLLGLWSGWRFHEAQAAYAALLAVDNPAPVAGRHDPPPPPVTLRLVLTASTDVVWSGAAQRPPRAMQIAARPDAPAAHARPGEDMQPASSPAQPARRTGTEPAAEPADAAAFAEADNAYRALARGERRSAAAGLAAALGASPAHANAGQWAANLRQLRRRWSLAAYSLIRSGGGSAAGTSAAPLLGGGQSGARLGYTADPLARRPVELFARLSAAQDWADVGSSGAEAAFGAEWRPFGRHGPSLAAERLVRVGKSSRNAFALRIAGGGERAASGHLPLDVSAYAEAGIVGVRSGDIFAGGQAYALYPLRSGERTRVRLGVGTWGSVQDGAGAAISRLEIGPSAQVARRVAGTAVELRAEYRARIAGSAAPGSGPAITVTTRF